jgi:hypothetical protein
VKDPKNERHFLHDLISPLSSASNSLEVLVEQIGDGPHYKEFVKKLEPIMAALERVAVLVANRREYLVETEERDENGR